MLFFAWVAVAAVLCTFVRGGWCAAVACTLETKTACVANPFKILHLEVLCVLLGGVLLLVCTCVRLCMVVVCSRMHFRNNDRLRRQCIQNLALRGIMCIIIFGWGVVASVCVFFDTFCWISFSSVHVLFVLHSEPIQKLALKDAYVLSSACAWNECGGNRMVCSVAFENNFLFF